MRVKYRSHFYKKLQINTWVNLRRLKKMITAGKKKKSRKKYAIEANFILDDLMHSGLVLFNDPVTNYVNEVCQELVKNDPILQKKKIHVYTLRSPEVNAFASDRGDVFVTLGLLAQLVDESQLAFILSHELIHVKKSHSLELFLEEKGVNSRRDNDEVLEETLFDQELLSHCAYSKELELEADSGGLELFLKSDYSPESINVVFDVLKYSYLPFDEIPFDLSFFESEHYRFPNKYKLGAVNPIVGEDEEIDDSEHTHPNIDTRRRNITKQLSGTNAEDKSLYLISRDRFDELRNIARYELPMLYLRQDRYPEAIYTAYLLLKENPENLYLKKCVAKSLYLDTKLKKSNDYSIDYIPEETEGESHQVNFLMDELGEDESNILALRYAYSIVSKHPDDLEVKTIVEDLFLELASQTSSLSDFYSTVPSKEIGGIKEESKIEEGATKYDKIKENKSGGQDSGLEKNEYWRFGFMEFINEKEFEEGFKIGQEKYEENKKKDKFWDSHEGQNQWKKRRRKIKNKGVALGIDSIVLVEPYYLRILARNNKKSEVKFLETEKGQLKINEDLVEIGERAGLNITLLSSEKLNPNDVQKFNDLRFLNDWYSEQINFFDLSLTPGLEQNKIEEIANRYNTRYFLWTGVISAKNTISATNEGGMISIKAVYPKTDLLFYSILYDVKTGKRQVLNFRYFDERGAAQLVRAHQYDTFWQIKRKSNKK